jgi:transposase-like protein
MAIGRQLERMAQALVEDSVLGGPAVCEKYGVNQRTLERWRARLRNDALLRRLYDERMSRVDAEFADSLTTRPALVVVRRDESGRRAKGANGRAARELADAAAHEIVSVAALAGLPEAKSVERSHALPSGRRVSLLVAHRDGSYTVCEVAPEATHDPARMLGHLLFCFEDVRMNYRLPAAAVRLCVLADHDAPPVWNRVLANVKVEVGFYNILGVVRGRLLSQNVLAGAAEGTR